MSDRSATRSVKFSAILIELFVAAVLLLSLSSSAHAQYSRTIHDGYTPPGVEEGTAAGSYPLTGFENINLHNGMLSVAFPLFRVGGR